MRKQDLPIDGITSAGFVGDLYCKATVETPVNLTKDQKELLRQLDDSLHCAGKKHSPQESSWSDKIKSFLDDFVT